jgi:hypothetical protein
LPVVACLVMKAAFPPLRSFPRSIPARAQAGARVRARLVPLLMAFSERQFAYSLLSDADVGRYGRFGSNPFPILLLRKLLSANAANLRAPRIPKKAFRAD